MTAPADEQPVTRGRARVLLVAGAGFNLAVGWLATALPGGISVQVAVAVAAAFGLWGAMALAGGLRHGLPTRWGSTLEVARHAGWPPVPTALAYWACTVAGLVLVGRFLLAGFTAGA